MLQLGGPELAETLFVALFRKAERVKIAKGRHGSQLRRRVEGRRHGSFFLDGRRRLDGRRSGHGLTPRSYHPGRSAPGQGGTRAGARGWPAAKRGEAKLLHGILASRQLRRPYP